MLHSIYRKRHVRLSYRKMAEQGRLTVEADPTKLDYLGRGVDCREPKATWLDKLDTYSADKIRDLAPNSENIKKGTLQKKNIESNEETEGSKKGAEASVKAKPHDSLKLGGELTVKRDNSKTTRYKIDSQTTKIIIMHDDTSQDPNIIKRDGGHHYTKYEQKLSQFIIEYIDTNQREVSSEEPVDTGTSPGKLVKDLEGADTVAKLEDYLQDARANKESGQQMRQAVANACYAFMRDEKSYTHYVSSIILGAVREESHMSLDSSRETSGGVQGNTMEYVDASLQGECTTVNKSTITTSQSRGQIDSDSGAVTAEEVIETKMKPVSNLINKKSDSPELRKIMEGLLQHYSHTDQGALRLLGPFHVSCRKQLTFGREHEIYWQVINDEIYGTTTEREASTFYVQLIGEQSCKIIHKKPRQTTHKKPTNLFITVQRPFKAHCPLKLVGSADQQDICFTLMNATKELVDVPATPNTWKSSSPFFIKLPMGSLSKGLMIMRPIRYVSIKKCDEVKQTTDSHSADATAKTPPKYTTASCATTDTGSNLLQFYFTPLVKLQKDHVALGGPPPPPSRIESDSSSAVQLQRQEDDIKREFIELVGREYVFPLQVKAEDIPDAESQ